MAEVLLLLLGVFAFVVLASTIVSWALPASSLGKWTKEKEKE